MSFQKKMQNFDITLPREEHPAEMVDRREEHPAKMADRREEQSAKMADRREEQPSGMVDRQEEQLAEMVDRRGQEEPKPVNIPEITPHFFKIILSPHASKLHIPDEFVSEYGANLGDLVLLEVPNGVVWKVKLQNSNGMVWLKEGWNKFKDYYSVGCGYFLLFRYNGNSHFSVFIFDLSASEIEYPPGPNEHMTPENRCVEYEPPEENGKNLPATGVYTNSEENPLTCHDNSGEEELPMTSMPSMPDV